MGIGRLNDKVAIVTGASSVLGRAIAVLFAAEGARLIVCADLAPNARPGVDDETDAATHDLICEQHGKGKAVFIKTDVTIGTEIGNCVAKAVEIGGRLDIMVDNAGIGGEACLIHELEEDTWDKTMQVNLRSVFLGCKYACAQFLQQHPLPNGHRGWIVNTASIFGLVGFEGGVPAYCAAKGGVVNLTRQVALDYAKFKIHCNAICPGFVKTAMTKMLAENKEIDEKLMSLTPMKEWVDKHDVVKAALFLASDDAAYITGVALPIDGGITAQ
ncbi:MAG: hypothetical protein Q9195_009341 [Heterodermia aff. obscurata]